MSDTYQAHTKLPSISTSSLRITQGASQQVDNLGVPLEKNLTDDMNGASLIGAGLKKEVGEYNRFLNRIIQVAKTQ